MISIRCMSARSWTAISSGETKENAHKVIGRSMGEVIIPHNMVILCADHQPGSELSADRALILRHMGHMGCVFVESDCLVYDELHL